jgi:hypothetical protein
MSEGSQGIRRTPEEGRSRGVLSVVLALMSCSFILFYKQKPDVQPGVEVKEESVAKTDVPARPESSWDTSAQIAFPAPGKDICLNDQTEEVKLVLRGGIKLLKTALVIEDAYPPILSRTGLGKAYMLAATDNVPEAVHIKGRLLVDPKFAAMLSDIVRHCCYGSVVFSNFLPLSLSTA